ncbi:MAG: UvrD-helicase domain-containing protein, partial [Bacteroidota bacterium]
MDFNPAAKTTPAFEQAYKQLNEAQQIAVNQIEGPVLVIAGPGTGKTQVLTLRIGQILRTQDVKPHNILCLTFTEAGIIAMRQRLIKFIGNAAFNVPIYTFHSFCNQVIQDNMDAFHEFMELRKVSDLEHHELIEELIDNLPQNNPLKKLYGNPYAYKIQLTSLFRTMKAEDWTLEKINTEIENALE